MANVTLSQLFKDICDSIRAKTGKTDKIEHLKIPEEIAKISAGFNVDNWLNHTVDSVETNVTAIPDYAFFKQSNLASVTMPNVKSIGTYAFNLSGVKSVELPDSCTTIGDCAFMQCYNLTEIKLPYGITQIPNACFRGDWQLKNPKIPNSVTNISSLAFSGAVFNTLDLARVTQIGQQVFYRTQYTPGTGIMTLILRNAGGVCALSSTNSFTNTPIGNCDDNAGIYVPDNLVDDYKKATNWSVFASIIKPISDLGA